MGQTVDILFTLEEQVERRDGKRDTPPIKACAVIGCIHARAMVKKD